MPRDIDLVFFDVAVLPAIAGGWPVHGVPVNGGVNGGSDRRAKFLCQMTKQSRRSRKQRHSAQQLRWQTNVGQRSTSHACTIERERAVKYLSMHSANRLEEPQMRPM
jgi:hypothetical protein